MRRPQRKWLVKESQSKSSYSKPTKASGFFNLVHFILKGQFVYTVYFELFEISLPNHWVCNFRGGLSNLAGKYPTSVSHGMNDMKEKKRRKVTDILTVVSTLFQTILFCLSETTENAPQFNLYTIQIKAYFLYRRAHIKVNMCTPSVKWGIY